MRLDTRSPANPSMRALAQMAVTFATSDVVRAAIRLVTSLAIARGAGPDAFGRWTLAVAWASALTAAFDLGFGVLITRDAARDDRQAILLVAGALATRLGLFTPIAAWGLWAAPAAFGGRPAAIAIAALAGAGIVYGSVAAAFRTDARRLVTIVAVEAAGALAQCAGSIVIVRRGGAVIDLLWLATAVLALEGTVAAAMLARRYPGSDHGFSVAVAAALFRRAIPFAGSGLIANAQARLAPILLGALGGPGDLAAFGVATRIEAAARRLPYAAFGAALPAFASPGRRRDDMRRRFERATAWFAASAAAALVAGAAPLVRILYGPAFAPAVVPLMWAGAALVPSLVNAGRRVYLNAIGHERSVVRWSSVALAVQAAAAVMLIPLYGAAGAMVALGLGEAVVWAPLRAAGAAEAGAPDEAGRAVNASSQPA